MAVHTREQINQLTPAQLLVGKWLVEWGYTVEYEYQFCERKFRFDVAVPEARIGIECNGHWQGHHGAGWSAGAEKLNIAQMHGWRVLVFPNRDVLKNQRAYEFLREYFGPPANSPSLPESPPGLRAITWR